MLTKAESYEALVRGFRWRVPARYNIGLDACDKWAGETGRLALIHKRADGNVERYTFARLKRLSDKLANALAARGRRRFPTSPPTSWAPSPCRSSPCSGPRRWSTAWPTAAPRPWSPTPRAWPSWPGSATACRT
jgi:hypothetical protein